MVFNMFSGNVYKATLSRRLRKRNSMQVPTKKPVSEPSHRFVIANRTKESGPVRGSSPSSLNMYGPFFCATWCVVWWFGTGAVR